MPSGQLTSGAVRADRARPASTWTPRWMPAVFVAFVLATAAAQGLFWIHQDGARSACFVASRVLSVLAFAVGALTSRRGFRSDWLTMFAAIALWAVADVSVAVRTTGDQVVRDWLGSGVMSMGAFVLMGIGAVRLARRDGFALGASVALDSVIISLSVAMMWWIVVGQEMAVAPGAVRVGLLLASVSPAGDALLLVAASALMSSRASHALSSRALVAMSVAALAGDLGFGLYISGQAESLPPWVPALWMLQFAFAAMAAMLSGRTVRETSSRTSSVSIVLVLLALVAPPLVLALPWPARATALHPATFPALVAVTGTSVVLASWRVLMLLRRIERQAEQLAATARTDELTQLPNRRAGDRILEAAITSARRSAEPLSLALLDLDHFKRYNDTYGHQQGDRLLRAAALAWSTELEGAGEIYRFGGEEFVVVLPALAGEQAEELMGRLHEVTPREQTFSAGLATLRPDDDAVALVGRADASLYAAKAAGRARTMITA
ncbi:GGDEF domain-containing protein [Arsenicicoccus sp. oral taxon 190]|uniref:GGDEF domain-containing protein n=1 Tax=Arsenicicoccus sp. oral taxon 190 TaxID=1658671 RepID=UPI00067BF669|nr:GGDEF domain-containing protein [Arsenicicoccus sp. oral taxon 190]